MENPNIPYVRHKVEDGVYSQIAYSGRIRWRQKKKDTLELILQQEEITKIIENYVVARTEVKWVDVPVEWIKE
jgi:hypothetical protein